jgi:hypothetical protein
MDNQWQLALMHLVVESSCLSEVSSKDVMSDKVKILVDW